ncbi:PREDICTED: uncharacterized protein LOC107330839 isoform X2 [Acropora digitifera]|uniref:uncharacterized protein LOC107330839 isoform X2 n=1 Tax=Acropora digitifera TaxID=70779 RepID=UPI00077AAA3B|nr:PREDICTED: uncharacterized protein LOC107330839 isoform X2 [Acropora digitifera]
MEKTGFNIVALCNCAVEAPVVYVISGTDLTLNCEINGSIILTDQVSWKHNGVWLHNLTHRVDRKLQLVIPRIHEQQHGVYQCSVFNVSKQSVNLLPRDANVTVLIGARIRKPQCIKSNGRRPPTTLLLWNTVKNEQSDLQFTYHVLFCYNPSLRNKFCLHPPRGYSMFKHCPPLDLQSNNIKPISECNITLLFSTLFPNVFDPAKPVSGNPKIHFVISFGNVQSESYSHMTICDPTVSGIYHFHCLIFFYYAWASSFNAEGEFLSIHCLFKVFTYVYNKEK